ncbi:MAG: dipeptidase [Pseudomonadales bacterium]
MRILGGIVLLLLVIAGVALAIIPGRVENATNVNLEHDPYVIRPEIQALHNSLFVVDLHTDSLLWKRDLLKESAIGHLDVPRMQQGNVAVQVFSATTKSPEGQNYDSNTADSDRITMLAMASLWPVRTWDSIYERATFQLDKLKDFAAASEGELVLIESKEDFARFVDLREQGENVIAAIYLIEGAHPLEGDLNKLDALYDQGLRIAGFTHFFDNLLGGSLHGVSQSGLTQFGRDSLARMNELGVIIDVAHASPKMVGEILDLSSEPVILSHGGMKGVCDQGRNLDDALMQRIAEQGGLVGIGYWAGAVCDVTPEGVVQNIRYAIDLLGVEHVALGSDYDGATAVMFDTSELAILTQVMVDEGFTEHEIRSVMGENAKRFFLEYL